jgi:HPt (histidine-containing phosphotransfer) domain-containing protein
MVTFPPNDLPNPLAGHLPLFDDRPLREMLTSLGDDLNAVVGFVCAFIGQWPARLARIDEQIRIGDPEGALTAVLSLKVSSQMIGAVQLDSLSTELERIVRAGDFSAALDRVETLHTVGAETLLALEAQRERITPSTRG